MSRREKKIVVTPDEWWASHKFRHKITRQARRRARRELVVVDIMLKDRFGTQRVAHIDGRFWLFPEDNVPWTPPPTEAEQALIDQRRARTERLRPPKGLFD